MNPVLMGLIALVAGAGTAYAVARASASADRVRLERALGDVERAQADLAARNAEVLSLKQELARLSATLEHERKAGEEKLALVARAERELKDAFAALSADALRLSNTQFLELAKTVLETHQATAMGDLEQRQKAIEGLMAPLKESIEKVTAGVQEIEKSRRQDYGQLAEQVTALMTSNRDLQLTTGNLVKALRQPVVRGAWGEMQLRKVVELAGMVSYCDFVEQESTATAEGRIRPDLIVKLPGGKKVVVDAKAPLQAYLDALESPDEAEKLVHLADHARQIRDHMTKLGAKAYWDQFPETPEFVVMFLPGEMFFSEALKQDPNLIETGVNQGVILANPTTLIALLKAVAYGWRQEKITESAEEISELGRELYERLAVMVEHLNGVGRHLDKAVESFNKAAGSVETRVSVSARRFTELGCPSGKEMPVLEPVERHPREIQAPAQREGKE